MATARDKFDEAQKMLTAADECDRGTPEEFGFLLEGILQAVLAVGMGLGVHLPPLPGLDCYCLCSDALGRLAKHEADCPHYKPANDEGPAVASAEPSA